MRNDKLIRMRNHATALVALHGKDKIMEWAKRGERDPASLTDSQARAVCALPWLNTDQNSH